MSLPISEKRKIDGVCIISQNLDVLKPTSIFTLKLPLPRVQKQFTSKVLKGSRTFYMHKFIYSIKLDSIYGFDTYLMFYGPDTGETINSEVKAITERTLFAVMDFLYDSGTESGQCWMQLKKSEVRIYSSDFKKFSEKLVSCLYAELRNRVPEVSDEDDLCTLKYKFACCSYGQSFSAAEYIDSLTFVNEERAAEIILHVAVDYSIQGHYLGFVREKLIAMIGANPSDEYYPDALRGVGNYVYYLVSRDSSADDVYNDDSMITMVKFYSQNIKYAHANNRRPFAHSLMGEFIQTTCMESLKFHSEKWLSSKRSELQGYEAELVLVDQLCAPYRHGCYARAEVMVSLIGDEEMADAPDVASAYLARIGNLQNTLFAVKIDHLLDRRRAILMPAATYIRSELSKVKALLNGVGVEHFNLTNGM